MTRPGRERRWVRASGGGGGRGREEEPERDGCKHDRQGLSLPRPALALSTPASAQARPPRRFAGGWTWRREGAPSRLCLFKGKPGRQSVLKAPPHRGSGRSQLGGGGGGGGSDSPSSDATGDGLAAPGSPSHGRGFACRPFCDPRPENGDATRLLMLEETAGREAFLSTLRKPAHI